jgi:hypothetical protein
MRETADLLTILHTQTLDIPRATCIAAAAGVACADNDVELSWLYLELTLISLARHAPEEFEARMNSLGHGYQLYFAHRYYGHGKVEGQTDDWTDDAAEGWIKIALMLLAWRPGPPTEATQAGVRGAQDAQAGCRG